MGLGAIPAGGRCQRAIPLVELTEDEIDSPPRS